MNSSALLVTTKRFHSRGTSEGTIITQPGVTVVDGTAIDRQVESYLTDVVIYADLIGTDVTAEDVSWHHDDASVVGTDSAVDVDPKDGECDCSTDAAAPWYWYRLTRHRVWLTCSKRTVDHAANHDGSWKTYEDRQWDTDYDHDMLKPWHDLPRVWHRRPPGRLWHRHDEIMKSDIKLLFSALVIIIY